MVKEEEKDLDKEEGLKRKDHPLSPADWIMFLSGNVSDCQTNSLTRGAMILAVMLVCLSGTIALLGGDALKQIVSSYLLVFCALVGLIVFILHVRHVNQRMKTIEKIIKDIIYRELKTHEDILKRCEEKGVFEQEND
jgi:hypothetical protein